jgi:hypothetical protein
MVSFRLHEAAQTKHNSVVSPKSTTQPTSVNFTQILPWDNFIRLASQTYNYVSEATIETSSLARIVWMDVVDRYEGKRMI